jgi:hypothetical protein
MPSRPRNEDRLRTLRTEILLMDRFHQSREWGRERACKHKPFLVLMQRREFILDFLREI